MNLLHYLGKDIICRYVDRHIGKYTHKHASICIFSGVWKGLSYRSLHMLWGSTWNAFENFDTLEDINYFIKRPVGLKNKIQGMPQFREDLEFHTHAIIIRMYCRNFTWLPIHIPNECRIYFLSKPQFFLNTWSGATETYRRTHSCNQDVHHQNLCSFFSIKEHRSLFLKHECIIMAQSCDSSHKSQHDKKDTKQEHKETSCERESHQIWRLFKYYIQVI